MDRTRLLALDLDGTLVRDDGHVDPRDAAAVERAARRGIEIVLATGRLGAGAVPIARALELRTPLVCADGAVVHFAPSYDASSVRALPASARFVDALAGHGLAPLVLTPWAIHCDAAALAYEAYAAGLAPELQPYESLAARTEALAAHALQAIGLGDRDRVLGAEPAMARGAGPDVEVSTFAMGAGCWALRVRARACSKGLALAELAARRGYSRESVAAVGDWYNDLSMFAWAGRSFAMGQAPELVRLHATDVLASTAAAGGGVAEAVERLLSA